MVNTTKGLIEMAGFKQLIRNWPYHSLVDQVWTDNPNKILGVRNVVRAYSDHNVVSANIRVKRKDNNCQEQLGKTEVCLVWKITEGN